MLKQSNYREQTMNKKQTRYTQKQAEAIAEKLKSLPPVEKNYLSKQELVAALADEIKSLQQRGYSLEQIADTLKGTGFDIATPTLRNYLQKTNKPKARKRAKVTPEKVTPIASKTEKPAASEPKKKGSLDISNDSEKI